MTRTTTAPPATGTDWRTVAEELAGALQETMLRNPGLTACGWTRAHAALGRFERAGGDVLDEAAELPAAPGA